MPLNSLLIYVPDKTNLAFKSAVEMKYKRTISLNYFIARTMVNRSIISNKQQFFKDIFPLSANHPLLILLNLLVVSSRITVNLLYCEFENKNFCTNDNAKNIVLTVEIICRQYLKILSYDGFIVMFNNIDLKLISGSFSLINKALDDKDEF